MSKQANPPPPGDKPVPTAPPRPPRWRGFVWLIALIAAFFLWLVLPTVHSTPTTSLTYSQFVTDASQHKVKTIDIAPAGGTSTGTLTSGTNYTVVIPPQADQTLLTQLQSDGVTVSAQTTGTSFGSEVLSWLLIFGLPLLFFGWLWFRMSRDAGGGLQGALGVGPVPGQGVRRGAALHHVRRRGRVRGRQGRDRRGGGLPPATRTGTRGSARWCRAAC